jgi:hypothetical protein
MPYSAPGYETRAEECVRLANLTSDEMIRGQLLTLRQTYLKTAGRLRSLSDVEPQD